MVEVVVFAEGQSEEQFIKKVVAPALRHLRVFIKPQILHTSRAGRGGAVSFDRLKFNARNTLRQNQHVVLSTFLDLYGLDTDFPAYKQAAQHIDVHGRVQQLEAELADALVAHIGCRQDRFIPHIQPYEFEGLLFSDVEALSLTEPDWRHQLAKLQQIRRTYVSPEHINDSYETKPSKRLEDLLEPAYKKTRHGPLAAARVTLEVMEAQCEHFGRWMNKLRALA